jgi:hypothetical protein
MHKWLIVLSIFSLPLLQGSGFGPSGCEAPSRPKPFRDRVEGTWRLSYDETMDGHVSASVEESGSAPLLIEGGEVVTSAGRRVRIPCEDDAFLCPSEVLGLTDAGLLELYQPERDRIDVEITQHDVACLAGSRTRGCGAWLPAPERFVEAGDVSREGVVTFMAPAAEVREDPRSRACFASVHVEMRIAPSSAESTDAERIDGVIQVDVPTGCIDPRVPLDHEVPEDTVSGERTTTLRLRFSATRESAG